MFKNIQMRCLHCMYVKTLFLYQLHLRLATTMDVFAAQERGAHSSESHHIIYNHSKTNCDVSSHLI